MQQTTLHNSSLTTLVALAAAVVLGTGTPPAVGSDCAPPTPAFFTVSLPKLNSVPAIDNPEDWNLPDPWDGHPNATSDSITVPNGRPIYALIISGYAINSHFDELLVYNFARHLMSKGAYVHWAWWNNLLAPYLERPLHLAQSHPGTAANLGNFATPGAAADKAVPADDYQFIADAKLFLSAIRNNNPEAIIILVGHSMGGAACARLADQVSSSIVIDLVAPLDPVGNRNYPWAGPAQNDEHYYNWTRWRATRGTFRGFKDMELMGFPIPECEPFGPWLHTYFDASPFCPVHVHNASAMSFGSNIINLRHRWQNEALFPFDFEEDYEFNANPPSGGTDSQTSIDMQSSGSEPGGWPSVNLGGDCCPIGPGVAWPNDGHGEIIGTRGPANNVRPLGTRVRTSPQCDNCPNQIWPHRALVAGVWVDSAANIDERVELMQALEDEPFCADPPACTNNPPPAPANDTWPHKPYNAALCKVSTGMINRFNIMNKPAVANAGPDLVVECNGCTSALVALNGTGSSDPENFALTYKWTWSGGSATGATPNVNLPYGPTCIELKVTDSVGHVSLDYVLVTVKYESGVVPYPNDATLWIRQVSADQGHAFDTFYPGVPNGLACLLPAPNEPAVLTLDGGTLTVSASTSGSPYCAITDLSFPPAVSDARLNNANSVLVYEFDPPVQAFYTYFGSLAVGQTGSMKLYSGNPSTLLDIIPSLASTDGWGATGLGFTAPAPIDRIEFASTDTDLVIVGAFIGLASGQQSLGTINLPGYQGPNGSSVQLNFGLAFVDPCPADTDDSGSVDVGDLLAVISAWGPCPDPSNCPADVAPLNGNEVVNVEDLLLVINTWGACPNP